MTNNVLLRDVTESDLPVLFEHQMDPEANQLAAFPARDREAFMAHWMKVLADQTCIKQTILFEGEVAGQIGCFGPPGEREIGYWIGRQYWGKGIGTKAVAAFLTQVTERPLFAHVAKHNLPSLRVLEKCGFRMEGEDKELSKTDGKVVEGFILKLT